MAITFFGSRRDTTPFLRYQIPSAVFHASSASIVTPLSSLITTGSPFAPGAVEIGSDLLNSTCAGLFCGEGVSTLGDAEGSTEASTEGLAVARGAGCTGWSDSCCRALELKVDVLEFSGAVCRDIVK